MENLVQVKDAINKGRKNKEIQSNQRASFSEFLDL